MAHITRARLALASLEPEGTVLLLVLLPLATLLRAIAHSPATLSNRRPTRAQAANKPQDMAHHSRMDMAGRRRILLAARLVMRHLARILRHRGATSDVKA